MIGLILAAGYGKRLAKISGNKNKCLIKVNGTCLIDHNLHLLESFGVDRIVIIVGHNASYIKEHIEKNFSALSITYVVQEPPRGIADAIRCALSEIRNEPFFMCLADEILVSANFDNMKKAFQKPDIDGVCGIVKSSIEQTENAYTVDFDNEGRIFRMKEKPQIEELYNNYRGTGYCLISPDLAKLTIQTPINQIRGEYELVDWLVTGLSCGLKLMAAIVGKHSININTEDDFKYAQTLLKENEVLL